MSNVGLVSLLLLAGIVLGMACVVLPMWFLLSLLQRQGLLPAVSRQQEQLKSVQQVEQPEAGHLREEPVIRPEVSKLIPGGQNQETFNEELMAVMAATLCAYGANHQKYRIKQVRVGT